MFRTVLVLVGLLLAVMAVPTTAQASLLNDSAEVAVDSPPVPSQGDCVSGVCQRPVASAVATAGRVVAAPVRIVIQRLQKRPLLRGLRTRCAHLLAPRCRAGCR